MKLSKRHVRFVASHMYSDEEFEKLVEKVLNGRPVSSMIHQIGDLLIITMGDGVVNVTNEMCHLGYQLVNWYCAAIAELMGSSDYLSSRRDRIHKSRPEHSGFLKQSSDLDTVVSYLSPVVHPLPTPTSDIRNGSHHESSMNNDGISPTQKSSVEDSHPIWEHPNESASSIQPHHDVSTSEDNPLTPHVDSLNNNHLQEEHKTSKGVSGWIEFGFRSFLSFLFWSFLAIFRIYVYLWSFFFPDLTYKKPAVMRASMLPSEIEANTEEISGLMEDLQVSIIGGIVKVNMKMRRLWLSMCCPSYYRSLFNVAVWTQDSLLRIFLKWFNWIWSWIFPSHHDEHKDGMDGEGDAEVKEKLKSTKDIWMDSSSNASSSSLPLNQTLGEMTHEERQDPPVLSLNSLVDYQDNDERNDMWYLVKRAVEQRVLKYVDNLEAYRIPSLYDSLTHNGSVSHVEQSLNSKKGITQPLNTASLDTSATPHPTMKSPPPPTVLTRSVLGYPIHEYTVHTPDGYCIVLFRLTHPESKKVVYFQHGVMDTALAWVSSTPSLSLAVHAFNKGFDVFFGSFRGTDAHYASSRKRHESLSVESSEYWDYSVDDLVLDYTLFIRSILVIKNREKMEGLDRERDDDGSCVSEYGGCIHNSDFIREIVESGKEQEVLTTYQITAISHSMGGAVTIMYILHSLLSHTNHFLYNTILLSPAGFLGDYPLLTRVVSSLSPYVLSSDNRAFPTRSSVAHLLVAKILQDMHRSPSTLELVQRVASTVIGGKPSEWPFQLVNYTKYPLGITSVRVMLQFRQWLTNGSFSACNTDDSKLSYERFRSTVPLDFAQLYKYINTHIHFIAGKYDTIVPCSQVRKHYEELRKYRSDTSFVEFENAGHLQFTIGLDHQVISYVMRLLCESSYDAPENIAVLDSVNQDLRLYHFGFTKLNQGFIPYQR